MAKRDMYKIAESVKINKYYCMNSKEYESLIEQANEVGINGKFYAIQTAFHFGYAMGQRAEKAERA